MRKNEKKCGTRQNVLSVSTLDDISVFRYNGSSLKNEDCNKALKRIAERIDMDKVCALVEEAPSITELQKDRIMLLERKAKILDYSMELLLKQELSQREQQGL